MIWLNRRKSLSTKFSEQINSFTKWWVVEFKYKNIYIYSIFFGTILNGTLNSKTFQFGYLIAMFETLFYILYLNRKKPLKELKKIFITFVVLNTNRFLYSQCNFKTIYIHTYVCICFYIISYLRLKIVLKYPLFLFNRFTKRKTIRICIFNVLKKLYIVFQFEWFVSK